MSELSDHLQQRRDKLEALAELGYEKYPHKFEVLHQLTEIVSTYSEYSAEKLESDAITVQTAGRLVSLRGHGKASFGHLSGGGQKLQIYVRQDRVGDKAYELYRLFDVGDLIGVCYADGSSAFIVIGDIVSTGSAGGANNIKRK